MGQGENRRFYEIFKSKDVRYDGRIFVGVSSTGIYCRPTCKAKLPRAENCSYYATAAEAEKAGCRPCLVCRPELAPGNSRSDTMDTIARRAKLLLEENAGVKQPVAETAAALQVSDRHLRRAFQAACHVSPIEYLQTYRLLLAKNLLTETSLSITDIAFASGFGSITRFNTLFKDHYRITPGEFRKNSARRKNRQITVKIGYRPPYAYDAIFRFLQERRIPGVEKAEGGIYSRTIRV